jgi:hypothetical protein
MGGLGVLNEILENVHHGTGVLGDPVELAASSASPE